MLSPSRGAESAAIQTPARVLSPRPPAAVPPSGVVEKLASPNPVDFIVRKNGEQYESSLCNDDWSPVRKSISPARVSPTAANAVVVPLPPLPDPLSTATAIPPQVDQSEIQQHLLVLSSALETAQLQQNQLFNNFTQALAQRDKDWEDKIKTERHQLANVIDSIQAAVANEKERDEATYAVKLKGIAEMCSRQVNDLQQKLVNLARQAQEAVNERDQLLHKSREDQLALQKQLTNLSSQRHVQEQALHQLQSAQIQQNEMTRQRIMNQIQQQQHVIDAQQYKYQGHPSLAQYRVPALGNCLSTPAPLAPSSRSPSVAPQELFLKNAYTHLQRHQSHIDSQRRSHRSMSSSTTSFPTVPYINMTEL
eukprot:TRINITY_DN31316_c0_g1_i1.p1 TRINITY_DN31316_c0_g1~~TRINITY_DN31316_c0_g1_i1.p1  ORF type:complete len:365 (+),score=63.52 TRINITY_DN31316_c0_g1_i1:44-1138(+)